MRVFTQLLAQLVHITNLNEKIHQTNGAIQHPDHLNESNSAIKSTPQGVADHNFLIKTVSPA